MARRIFLLAVTLGWSSLSLAQQPPSLIRLQAGKNPEGITVNPVTHKAYVAAELDNPDRRVLLVFDSAALNGLSAPKAITIPEETEYLTVDTVRNRIYLSTKYAIKTQDVETGADDETGSESEIDNDDGGTVTAIIPGTLTVIDGNTDTLLASFKFPLGFEPEGVAVDLARNIVYVGLKAPEPEPENGKCPAGIFFIDYPLGDEECWTAGSILAFNGADITTGPIKTIPAGDDPESVVFVNDIIYAANEDDGTVTAASAVNPDGSGGQLLTDAPMYSPVMPPYGLGVFYPYGPNPLACADKRYETDKMAGGWDGFGYSVYITDDRSRVARIQGTRVVGETGIPIDPILGQCVDLPNSDENGLNVSNNIALMQTGSGPAVYVVSEQNTVAILDPLTLALRASIQIPGAVHLDAIGVDGALNRIWITDEDQMAVFVLQGACASGTGVCTATTPGTPPAVMTQPGSQTVTARQTATFTSSASGVPAPTVQWQVFPHGGSTWSNITGATSTGYTTPLTTTDMNGYQFRAVFTNSAGTANSNAAILTVNSLAAPPAITAEPASQAVTAGQTTTFTSAASGSPAPTVQWQLSTNGGALWSNIAGATSTSYTTPATTTAMNGYQFRAVFTNTAGTATSNAAFLTVKAPATAPEITAQPANQAVFDRQMVSFTSAASGNPSPTVQWQLSTNGGATWSNIAGATSTSYTIPVATLDMSSYQFRAVFTNSAGTGTSNAALLTVTAPSRLAA